MRYDRLTACAECPFKPGGILGSIRPERYLQAIHEQYPTTCHMSYGEFLPNGKFQYFERPVTKLQHCAGYLIFAKNIGVTLDTKLMNDRASRVLAREILGFPGEWITEINGGPRTLEEQITQASDDTVYKTVKGFLQRKYLNENI